jgi:hypothetical protein
VRGFNRWRARLAKKWLKIKARTADSNSAFESECIVLAQFTRDLQYRAA